MLLNSSVFAQNSKDSTDLKLKYPTADPAKAGYDGNNRFNFGTPSNVKENVKYDPKTGNYNFNKTIGDSIRYGSPSYMGFDEYLNYSMEKSMNDYWKAKADADRANKRKGIRPELKYDKTGLDQIFGSTKIDIKPSGSAQLTFGGSIQKTNNPALPVRSRKTTNFDFTEKIQLNVIGSIGDKMKLNTSYNTEATFDFENQMKLAYEGKEDQIIQGIEAGNVTLPLKGSLITGSQSLFGIKTKLKFGRLTVTSVFSQQKGNKSEIKVKGGAQITPFELKADEYEENKHFFLTHFFRDLYEKGMSTPPVIATGINITKVEVWVTSTNRGIDNRRNVIAFQDLGEENPTKLYNPVFVNISPLTGDSIVADNNSNNLYNVINNAAGVRTFIGSTAILNAMELGSKDYRKIEGARRLSSDDYFIHRQLGYISLNQNISPNQVLAVAFQYTYKGKTHQIGDFSTDGFNGQDALLLKMLKSTELNTKIPMWDLMMKNVYALGAFRMQKKGFQLEIQYLNAKTGIEINFLPEGKPKGRQIIGVLGLDKINTTGNPTPDGVFDFIDTPQMTINPNNGKIYFPMLEPFGSGLRRKFDDQKIADKFAFDSLYTTTLANARVKFPGKNRFTLRGQYQSDVGSEISLNALNVPQGSVVVTAGGITLVENQDYTVDYTLGRVSIINQSYLESGTPIKVSLESNSLFAIQTKTLMASRFDYEISDKFMLGATVMHLSERPITQKVNIGNEPMSNTMYGFDGQYSTESRFLTKMVDKLPFLETKEKSTINLSGEFAQLLPGHSGAIGKKGVSYIDDFEGSQTSINMRSFITWKLAAVPQGQADLFPEGSLFDTIAQGYNRARIAWHVIDRIFYVNDNATPQHIKDDADMRSNHFMREIFENEVFPNKQLATGTPGNIAVLDVAYYPEERGPYNYDVEPTNVSAGIDTSGQLNNPSSRWAGITRRIETTNFNASNIQFIQFWMMDPFAESGTPGFPDETVSGQLYFNLGDISEDVLRDSYKSFENVLPDNLKQSLIQPDDTLSSLGRVTRATTTVVSAFNTDPKTREFQDVGLDGLRTEEEKVFYKEKYLDRIANNPSLGQNSTAYTLAEADPSGDNYNYYRDDKYDAEQLNILDRYKRYNDMEGNSATSEFSATKNAAGYPTQALSTPDVEDVNKDANMNEVERYYQYRVNINANEINPSAVGSNFITNVQEAQVSTANGELKSVNWYQFKIPIEEFEKAVGGIADFQSIRFMRMYMKGFKKPVFLRFARLQLIRGEWRKFNGNNLSNGEFTNVDLDEHASFNISAVNLEENGSRTPVNYVVPPGIVRQNNLSSQTQRLLNEQALSMQVCGLKDGEEVKAYRNFDYDLRSYRKLELFAHAEARNGQALHDGDLSLFVRLGTDFQNNYYEYEIPLNVTLPGFYQSQPDSVWPKANNVAIVFKELTKAKLARNALLPNISLIERFSQPDLTVNNGKNIITVVGNPILSGVKTVMIGIRNKQINSNTLEDDGLAKCAEIWVNELRVTDFNQNSGWAAIGRVTTRLADFANISMSGSISTPGFGSIEKKVSERQRETNKQVDISTTLQLGKFFPSSFGLRIPMFVGYSKNTIDPQYAPLQPDVYLSDFLANSEPNQRDSLRQISTISTSRKSINFTNIRKNKSKNAKKSHFYDVSNLTATYAYTEQNHRDLKIKNEKVITYKGGLTYSFSAQPKNIKPFSKIKLFKKHKFFKLITDFNFFLGPKQVSMRSSINRLYNERTMRVIVPGVQPIPSFINKNFIWNTTYDMKYNLTKNLKLSFTANNSSRVLEPVGKVDNGIFNYVSSADTVARSFKGLGEATNYRHTTALTYTLPLSKFPLTNWITSSARYSADYIWTRASFAQESFGGSIQNSRTESINANGDFNKLYNKVGFLKKVNQKFRRRSSRGRGRGRGKPKPKNNKDKEEDKKKKKKNDKSIIDHAFHLLMSLKNIRTTYSQNDGMLLPGYNQKTNIIGMSPGFDAPGFGFVFGQQDTAFARNAGNNGWIVKNDLLNQQHTGTTTKTLRGSATLEPIKNLRILISLNKTTASSFNEFYRWTEDMTRTDGGFFSSQNPIEKGNMTLSINTLSTAFSKNNADGTSPVFQQFLANRVKISERLSTRNSDNSSGLHHNENDAVLGYKDGYGSTDTEVMIPAFIAAYTGKNASKVKLNPFSIFPSANWTIRYTGLSKIKKLKKYFRTITLNHAYRSTMSINSYTTNINFVGNRATGTDGSSRDKNSNFFPLKQIDGISINEQFSPLINVDMTWQNSLMTRFEIRRSRTLSMNFSNTQLTDVKSNEIVIGAGYSFKNVPFPFELKKGSQIRSNVDTRLDVTIRDQETIIRKAAEGTNQATSGRKSLDIRLTADYKISNKLNLRAFYNCNNVIPKVSTSFPTTQTRFGITLRFSLSP